MERKTIGYERISHLVERQYEQEMAMRKELEGGNYTAEHPYVVVNPYFVNPLTALLLFNTEKEEAVTLTVKGKEAAGDITHTFPKAKEQILPVLGLYPEYDNTVVIMLEDGTAYDVTVTTEKIENMPYQADYINTTSDYMNGQLMFVTPAGDSLAGGYDYRGDCRWHLVEPFIFDMKPAANGRILIGSNRLLNMPYYTAGVCEMDLVGKIYTEYRIPGGYHHDQFEMEDGNLLVLTECFENGTVEDMCALIDRADGSILKTWDFKDILPQDAAPSGSWSAHDWFHNNALWYDKKTDSITLSGRHQDVLINIDFQSGKLNWILGDPEGWPEDMREAYFLKPVGDLEWQYEQHACLITPDGDVMTFDNGHYRSKNPEHYRLGKDNYSRGVRFSIDRENRTVRQIWQYGKERGNEFFSPYISNVDYYGEGNYLVHSGGIASLDGITCEGVGSRRYFENKNVRLESKTVELLDGRVVYEMCLNANYYRAKKMSLYSEGENLTLGRGTILGTLGKTPEFGTAAETEYSKSTIPDQYHLDISEEFDRYTFHGTFEKGQLVMLVLEDGEGNCHNYFVSTSAVSFTAMCVGTFQSSGRQVDFRLNKCGLQGEYAVSLIIDDTKYSLGLTLKIDG